MFFRPRSPARSASNPEHNLHHEAAAGSFDPRTTNADRVRLLRLGDKQRDSPHRSPGPRGSLGRPGMVPSRGGTTRQSPAMGRRHMRNTYGTKSTRWSVRGRGLIPIRHPARCP